MTKKNEQQNQAPEMTLPPLYQGMMAELAAQRNRALDELVACRAAMAIVEANMKVLEEKLKAAEAAALCNKPT